MKVLYMMAFALDSEATHHQAHIPDYAKVDEIPFDFERRIMSVVVRTPRGKRSDHQQGGSRRDLPALQKLRARW